MLQGQEMITHPADALQQIVPSWLRIINYTRRTVKCQTPSTLVSTAVKTLQVSEQKLVRCMRNRSMNK